MVPMVNWLCYHDPMVEITKDTQDTLDKLTRSVTAFPSWSEFQRAMEKDGYVPTLRPVKSTQVDQLRRILTGAGYRIWPEEGKR